MSQNIPLIPLTFGVLKFDKFKFVNDFNHETYHI